ncbi:hypothetical protein [Shewanella nanhaiensis]|uniref:DUF4342 domain-containing protein n=1 Tax=Shewanella nanhaiensis TaxID=2864872 RepID=A0ABS7E8H4_9GAMM|nr:hypothetical protein [Shewanella nanhaiensis]MBW8185970.1 hypothetical protein [Shewanella nanhaiensis]
MTESAGSNANQETESDTKRATSWSDCINKSKLWSSKIRLGLKTVCENGPKALVGVVSFSLFFMLGLVTLGVSLLAGVAAVIMMKWQQHNEETPPNNVAEPATEEQENVPVVAL